MFKRLFLFLCLLLLAGSCFASVYLVEPVDQRLAPNQEVFLGKAARGEIVPVVVKKKSDLSLEWNRLEADKASLPGGWAFESIETDKTLIGRLSISKNAPVSTQRIRVTALNTAEPLLSEAFFVSLSVSESLLDASLESSSIETVLGQEATFKAVLSNDSIAEHTVAIRSTLPEYWFEPKEITIPPKDTVFVDLPVRPYSYGEKAFAFRVLSMQNQASFNFNTRLETRPTLSGMFLASTAGFPFFSVGQLSFYIFNGFLSMLG